MITLNMESSLIGSTDPNQWGLKADTKWKSKQKMKSILPLFTFTHGAQIPFSDLKADIKWKSKQKVKKHNTQGNQMVYTLLQQITRKR